MQQRIMFVIIWVVATLPLSGYVVAPTAQVTEAPVVIIQNEVMPESSKGVSQVEAGSCLITTPNRYHISTDQTIPFALPGDRVEDQQRCGDRLPYP